MKKYLRIIFIISMQLLTVECGIDDIIYSEKDTNDIKNLAKCIIEIVNTRKYSKSSILISQTENRVLNDMTNIFLDNDVPVILTQMDNYSEQNNSVYEGNVYEIIHFEDCDSMLDFDYNNIRNDTKYFIIIYDTECIQSLQKVDPNIINSDSDFIVKDNDSYKLITYMPVIDANTCKLKETVPPIVINKCENGKMDHDIVFLTKSTSNMQGCVLKVGIASLFPFAIIENKSLYKDYDLISKPEGCDVEILKIIAIYLNATLEFRSIFRQEENPYIQSDFLKFVLNGSLEVIAGGLYRIYGDGVAYSGIYQRQAVIWVYTTDREKRSWSNFVAKVHGLYMFVLFYVLYCISWQICSYYDIGIFSLKTTFLYAWGALVGTASLQDARSTKQMVLNILYQVLCIHFSFYISVHLFSFLTIQNPPQIFRTNDEIMNSGRTPYLKTATKYFVQDSHYLKFANSSEECDSFLDCEDKTLATKGVTVVIDGLFFPYQFATAVDNEAKMLRATDNIITVYHEMTLRKESHILENFQKVMGRLFEAGICEQLYLEAIGTSVVARAKALNDNMMHNSYSCVTGCAITLLQFAGIFYIWIFGCIISCFVFLVELLVNRKRQ